MKMYDNILEKVETYEEKWGIRYAKPDGNLYKYTKVFYILAYIYATAMNLFFVVGAWLSNAPTRYVYTISGLSVGLIAALVLTAFKKSVIASICSLFVNALSCVCLVLTFAPVMENVTGGYVGAFYWRHFVPLCLVLITNACLNIIVIRANFKTCKIYKKIVENAYDTHHTSIEDEDLSEEEWDEVLKNI